MHFLKISLAVVAVLTAQVAGQSSNSSNIYADYNYCQGISPIAHKTYAPIVSPANIVILSDKMQNTVPNGRGYFFFVFFRKEPSSTRSRL